MAAASVTLTAASPGQAAVAGPLLYATGPRVFDFLYGDAPSAAAVLAYCFAKPHNGFSHALTTAAVVAGDMVGLELGYALRQKPRLDRYDAVRHLAYFRPWRWPRIVAAARTIMAFIPPPAPDEYYVKNLAVSPQWRSRGVGDRLLQHAFERAAGSGYAACTLDVAIPNVHATRFYRRMGMTVQQELRRPALEARHDLPGYYRMVKALG